MIEVPGFDVINDEYNRKVIDQIRELFTYRSNIGLTTLDAICFMLKNPAALSLSQKYIFDTVFSMFDTDMKGNVCTLFTFSDNEGKFALKAFTDFVGDTLSLNNSFFFNSSCVFDVNGGTESEFLWNKGMNNCESFFSYLRSLQPVSVSSTMEILNKRKIVMNNITYLQNDIDNAFSELNAIDKELVLLLEYKQGIEDNKNYTYRVEESSIEKVILSKGIYATYCLTCNFTCNEMSKFQNDENKRNVPCFGTDGLCKNCPQHCTWQDHHNSSFSFRTNNRTVTKTYTGMREKFENANENVRKQEKVLNQMFTNIKRKETEIKDKIDLITEVTRLLKDKSIRPDPENTLLYRDHLISFAKHTRLFGGLQALKKCKDRFSYVESFQTLKERIRATNESFEK